MMMSCAWEVDSCSTDQELPCHLCNPKDYNIHKSSGMETLLPKWIQFTLYFFKIYLNIIFWFMQSFPSVVFLTCFLSRILYTFLISPLHATCCPIHFIVIHLITLVLLYKTSLNKILLELPMDITASVGIQHMSHPFSSNPYRYCVNSPTVTSKHTVRNSFSSKAIKYLILTLWMHH
jgi:hypothetical protein